MKTVYIRNNVSGHVSTLEMPESSALLLVERMNSEAAKATRERLKLGDLYYYV